MRCRQPRNCDRSEADSSIVVPEDRTAHSATNLLVSEFIGAAGDSRVATEQRQRGRAARGRHDSVHEKVDHHSFEWYQVGVDEKLTEVQEQVLEALRRRADQGEPGPTYRELCAEFGWASTGTARDHLSALARKGYIERPGGHRQLRLREERVPVTRVPLLGLVVAGAPVISEENIEQRIPVPSDWTARGTYFALRVAGDSMRDAGILEGDQVVVRQQATAGDGEIVVATLDGETTLKRLRLRGGSARLIAENPRYQPIEIRTESAVIQGVVVGLLRGYDSARRRRAPQVARSASGESKDLRSSRRRAP